MRQAGGQLNMIAPRQGLFDITSGVLDWLHTVGPGARGLLTLFCRHTSASLLIQENASPDAHRDLEHWLARIAPESDTYEHALEGPDDMPSHLRAAVTATQLSIPVADGVPVLGTWQGIFLFEHRRDPPRRTIALHYIGD